MAIIRSFRDLEVYQLALAEAKRVFVLTKTFPREEVYSLTDQIRRASRSVSAQISEAWAKRAYRAAFVSKLTDALGEAMETQTWLDHARVCSYINAECHKDHDDAWQRIGGKINRMIQRADTFCGNAA